MNILIAGGSGLLGSYLTSYLVGRGHLVRHLTRKKYTHILADVYEWNVREKRIEPGALENLDVVINLAGAGVADKKWTLKRRETILNSRMEATGCLIANLDQLKIKPRVIIQASAIGYYGNLPFDKVSGEIDEAGGSFLAEVCRAWESEARKFEGLGNRVVILRMGVVLSDRGGALPKIMSPIKFFAGAALGSGDQVINWIHILDLCAIVSYIINDPKIQGTFNVVTSESVTNKELTEIIGQKLNRPIWLPNVPAFVLKMMLGQMAEIVLEGNRVSNQKILDTGFVFKYKTIREALDELLSED